MSLDLTLKNREFNFKVVNSHQHKVYEFENFRLDASTLLLYRSGEQVLLTPKAVETLIALIESQGEVISKEELMQKIWFDTIVEESNLAQYLHVLRKTLCETSDGKSYIETLKRRGYRFNGAVRVVKNGNGFVSPTEYAEDLDQPRNGQPNVANLISRRAERRGNVQVFSNLAAMRETAHPVNVERSDNIYTVSDWNREPVADASNLPPAHAGGSDKAYTRSKWFLPLALVVLVAGCLGIVFGMYKFTTRGQSAEARSVPFRGSDITRLTTSGKSKRAAISPDGMYVAHIIESTDGDSLWVRQVAVANDTRIAGPSQSEFVWVTFAPDGNFVYYLALARDRGDTELFRVPVLGGPIVKIAHDIGAPAFSPDGTKIAYMMMKSEETRLIVATADGMSEALQTSRHAPDYLKPNEAKLVSRFEPDYLNSFWYAPAWSPDGKSLAFPVNQSDEKGRYETVLAVDVETGGERKLTTERWQQVGQPRWL